MKLKKILLRSLLTLLVLLILLVSLGPLILYKQQKAIVARLITELNETFVGHFQVGDSHISPFKQFPYISIDLEDVRFYATKDTLQKPMYEVGDFYAGFNIKDVLEGIYDVKRLRLENGHLDLVQHPDGSLNLLVAKGMNPGENDPSTDTSAFHFALNAIRLKNMDITWLNEKDSLLFESYFSSAKASFSIKDPVMASSFEGDMEWNIVQKGDTSFFKQKKVHLSVDVAINQEEQTVAISNGAFNMDGGEFGFMGSIDMDDDLKTHLELHGNKPDFNLLLAFAPPALLESFKAYSNEGKVFFDAALNGHLAPGKKYALTVNFGCEEGYFQNTVSEQKLDDLGFKGSFTNGADSSWESAELKIANMYARPGTGVFKGDLLFRNFIDPHIAVKLHSDLNLKFLEEFLNIEALNGMSGQVLLDMDFNELIDFSQPENNLVQLKKGIDSELRVKNFSFFSKTMKLPVKNLNILARMRDGRLDLDTLYGKMGNSDIALSGGLNDLPAIFHEEKKSIQFSLLAKSEKLILKELLGFDTSMANKTAEEISDLSIKMAFTTSVSGLLDSSGIPKGEFYVDDFYAKLKNYPHTFHDFHADVLIGDSTMELKDFSGLIDDSDFHFSGKLNNYALWMQEEKKGITRFDFDLKSNLIRLEDVFSYNGENYVPEDYRHEELKELLLHGNVDLRYDGQFRWAKVNFSKAETKLKIHPMKFENFRGNMFYSDRLLKVTDFYGKMGKSDLNANITWYTGEDSLRKKKLNEISLTSNFLDIDALMDYHAPPDATIDSSSRHDSAFNIFQLPFTHLRFYADLKKVNHHKIWIRDVKASFRMEPNHYLYVDTLGLLMVGGSMGVKGYFNGSDPDKIYFKSTMELANLDMDKLLFRFDNFGQDYQLNKNFHGMLSGTVNSTFLMHPDLVPVLDQSEAEINMLLTDGSLVDFTPMEALSSYFKDKNLKMVRFDTLRNTLSLKKAVLEIPVMNINSSLGFIEIGGKQGLDMNMDYLVRVPLKMVTQVGFRALFGGKKKEEVDPEQEDAIVYRDTDKKVAFVNVRITGTPDDYKMNLGKR